MAVNIIKGCGAFIYSKSTNRYLFLLRNNKNASKTWGIVGGKLNANETMLEGLTREIEEELGGRIVDAKLIPIEKYVNNDRFSYDTFLICVDEEFIPALNHEHSGYCWVPLDFYPRPMHPGVYRSLTHKKIRDKIKLYETVTN